MDIQTIPFNSNEKGIIVLRGVSDKEAHEIISKLREWGESSEPKFIIWSPDPDISIEFVRVGQVEDIKAE
jgi:hypothetical protein